MRGREGEPLGATPSGMPRFVAEDAAAERAFAEALWEEAVQAARMGDAEVAAVMRDLSRRHRVGALELDACVTALVSPFGARDEA